MSKNLSKLQFLWCFPTNLLNSNTCQKHEGGKGCSFTTSSLALYEEIFASLLLFCNLIKQKYLPGGPGKPRGPWDPVPLSPFSPGIPSE